MRYRLVICLSLLILSFGFSATLGADEAKKSKMTYDQFREWNIYHNAGWQALTLNKLQKAEYCFREAVQLAKLEAETDPRLAARSFGDLAWVMHREGRNAEALPIARWALSVREKWFGNDSTQVTQTLYTVASIEIKLNHLDEAEDLLSRALVNCQRNRGPRSSETADAMEDLADVCMMKRQFDKAKALFDQSLAIRSVGGVPDPSQAFALDGLATIEIAEGKYNEAEEHLDRIVKLIPISRTLDSEFCSKIYTRQAEVYRKLGKTDLAEKAEAKAKSVLEPSGNTNRNPNKGIPRYQGQIPGMNPGMNRGGQSQSGPRQ